MIERVYNEWVKVLWENHIMKDILMQWPRPIQNSFSQVKQGGQAKERRLSDE